MKKIIVTMVLVSLLITSLFSATKNSATPSTGTAQGSATYSAETAATPFGGSSAVLISYFGFGSLESETAA